MHIDISLSPSDKDLQHIRQGLSQYNIAQVPDLVQQARGDFLVVMRENGKIVAGTVCDYDWGWIFFDAVWTDESVRGKGYGSLVMKAAETYAMQQGIPNAYLMTTSFQARPFYEKLGYDCYGEQVDRPKGHTFYYMRKMHLISHEIDPRITIESPPNHDSMTTIDNGLLDDIARTAPFSNEKVTIFLRDDKNIIQGGLIAGIFWDWMDLRILWLDESVKRQGWGKQLLQAAEDEAKKRDCIGITSDTADFQAIDFYKSQGYSIIGTLENRPIGHQSHFIEKRFLT